MAFTCEYLEVRRRDAAALTLSLWLGSSRLCDVLEVLGPSSADRAVGAHGRFLTYVGLREPGVNWTELELFFAGGSLATVRWAQPTEPVRRDDLCERWGRPDESHVWPEDHEPGESIGSDTYYLGGRSALSAAYQPDGAIDSVSVDHWRAPEELAIETLGAQATEERVRELAQRLRAAEAYAELRGLMQSPPE
ncbi:MAG: hypothetical protein R3F62_08405 [Planctomycetota bacterium]